MVAVSQPGAVRRVAVLTGPRHHGRVLALHDGTGGRGAGLHGLHAGAGGQGGRSHRHAALHGEHLHGGRVAGRLGGGHRHGRGARGGRGGWGRRRGRRGGGYWRRRRGLGAVLLVLDGGGVRGWWWLGPRGRLLLLLLRGRPGAGGGRGGGGRLGLGGRRGSLQDGLLHLRTLDALHDDGRLRLGLPRAPRQHGGGARHGRRRDGAVHPAGRHRHGAGRARGGRPRVDARRRALAVVLRGALPALDGRRVAGRRGGHGGAWRRRHQRVRRRRLRLVQRLHLLRQLLLHLRPVLQDHGLPALAQALAASAGARAALGRRRQHGHGGQPGATLWRGRGGRPRGHHRGGRHALQELLHVAGVGGVMGWRRWRGRRPAPRRGRRRRAVLPRAEAGAEAGPQPGHPHAQVHEAGAVGSRAAGPAVRLPLQAGLAHQLEAVEPLAVPGPVARAVSIHSVQRALLELRVSHVV